MQGFKCNLKPLDYFVERINREYARNMCYRREGEMSFVLNSMRCLTYERLYLVGDYSCGFYNYYLLDYQPRGSHINFCITKSMINNYD